MGATRLHEVGPTQRAVSDNQIIHNIEHMADIGAIDLLVWYVNRRSTLNFKWISRISYADLHRIALVASGVMCAAWHAYDYKQGRDGSHPTASARFACIVAHYAGKMSSHKGEDFFRRKIAGLAFYDLISLGRYCPELAALVEETQAFTSDQSHSEYMESSFLHCRQESYPYEFLTEKELAQSPVI